MTPRECWTTARREIGTPVLPRAANRVGRPPALALVSPVGIQCPLDSRTRETPWSVFQDGSVKRPKLKRRGPVLRAGPGRVFRTIPAPPERRTDRETRTTHASTAAACPKPRIAEATVAPHRLVIPPAVPPGESHLQPVETPAGEPNESRLETERPFRRQPDSGSRRPEGGEVRSSEAVR